MDDTEKLILSCIGALVVVLVGAMICYVFKHIAEKRLDQVILRSKLSISGDIDTIHRIGCPGIMLTVKCEGKRAAKLAKTEFSVSLTKDDLAAFEHGFQFPLGQSDNPALPAARLHIQLIPLSNPTNDDGFVLERDDVARFHFPIAVPPLPIFLRAPSEDVQVTAIFFDGSSQILQNGLRVQEMLREAIDVYSSLPMQLKSQLTMSVTVSAERLPDAGNMIGTLNPNDVTFTESQQPIIEAEFTRERMERCLSILDEIWNHWSTSKTLQYVVIPSQKIDLDNPHTAMGATFSIGVTSPTHNIGLVDLLVVFSILGQSAAAARSIDPNGAKEFSVQSRITTSYTSAQASAMLRQIALSPPGTA